MISKNTVKRFIWVSGLVLLLLVPIILRPTDTFGWALLYLNFAILLLIPTIRRDKGVATIMWFLLIFHEIVALIEAYFFLLPYILDARGFELVAKALALHPNTPIPQGGGANIYVLILGTIYRLFYPSLLFGEELSILAFILSCIILIKLMDLLELKKHRPYVIALYGFLPMQIMLSSLVMREQWEALFFMLSFYWGLRYHLKSEKIGVLLCAIFGIAMGLLHYALMIYAFFFIPFFLFWKINDSQKSNSASVLQKSLIAGILLFVSLLIGKHILTSVLHSQIKSLNPIYLFKYAIKVRSIPYRIGKTSYSVKIQTSSLSGFFLSALLSFVYFLFAPFPWMVKSLSDSYALFESCLRFLLVLFSFSSWRYAKGITRRVLGFMLLTYLSMNFMWSIGVNNYGTSIRHLMVSYWILVVVGGPSFIHFLLRVIKAPLHRSSDSTLIRNLPIS